MRYRTIPRTDIHASSICLGTASIGSTLNEADSFKMLDTFVDLGGNFLDTSLNYADWQCEIKSVSEKTIGKWMKLRQNRNRIVVGTKGGCPKPAEGRFFRLSREELEHDLQKSLSNLQVSTIDLYWLHRDDPSRPVSEMIDFLHEQVIAGKIRSFGCSNWSVERIEEARAYSEAAGKYGFCANQMMWSLAEPNPDGISDKTLAVMDQATKKYHETYDLAAVPFSSQAGGFFGRALSRTELEKAKPSLGKYFNDVNFGRLERVREVAGKIGAAPSAVALAVLFAQPYAVYPIIGSRTTEQLADSCAAGQLRLEEKTARYIETGE